MEVVYVVVGIAGTISLVVVVLTLFFRLLSWLDRKVRPELGIRYARLKDVFDPERSLTIVLVDGRLENVKFLGSLPDEFDKCSSIPLELRSMIVVEHPDGRRSLIRARSIKSMEIPPRDARPAHAS